MRKILFFYRQKHPFFVPLLTIAVLFVGTCFGLIVFSGQTIGAPDTRVIRLSIDGEARTVPTRAQSVKDFLSRAGVELSPEDVVEPMLNSPLKSQNSSINVYRARLVTVVDSSGQKVTAKIAESSPAALAKKAGFKLFPEDQVVATSPDEALADGVIGEQLVVKRATPAILNLYGNNFPVRTQAKTVGDLLKERDIKLLEGDTVQPSENTPIAQNIQIFILGHGKQLITVSEAIEQPEERREDVTMEIGQTKVLEEGAPGKRVVTYEVTLLEGKESSRREIQSFVVEAPQKKILIVGAKKNSFEGGFEAALARLRSCEGSYSSNTGNGYFGAYQFNLGSWRTNAPAGYKDYWEAGKIPPPGIQDLAASNYYQRSGWRPWPACSNKLGLQDIYR